MRLRAYLLATCVLLALAALALVAAAMPTSFPFLSRFTGVQQQQRRGKTLPRRRGQVACVRVPVYCVLTEALLLATVRLWPIDPSNVAQPCVSRRRFRSLPDLLLL